MSKLSPSSLDFCLLSISWLCPPSASPPLVPYCRPPWWLAPTTVTTFQAVLPHSLWPSLLSNRRVISTKQNQMTLRTIRLSIALFWGIKTKLFNLAWMALYSLPHDTSVTSRPTVFPLHTHCMGIVFSLQIHHAPSCHRILLPCSPCWKSLPSLAHLLTSSVIFNSAAVTYTEKRSVCPSRTTLCSLAFLRSDKDPSMG